MSPRIRYALTLSIGLLSGLICYVRLSQRQQLAQDFTWTWRAARLLVQGENPYRLIRPEGDYPYQTYFYYPLPAAVAGLPFAPLPPYLAGATFFGLSSAALAYALTQDGWHRLTIFAGAPYWVALAVAQWSPLLVAATLLPGLGWLLVCKPNLGLAGFLYRPTWRTAVEIFIFLIISLIVLPSWPLDWLRVSNTLRGHLPAILILPAGPLLLLSALRWKTPEGRLLLALSLTPQLLFFYDQLILGLIPKSLKSGLVFAGLSWIAYFAWRLTSWDPLTGVSIRQPTQFIIMLIYLPALFLLFWHERFSQADPD